MPFIVPFLPMIAKAGAMAGGSLLAGKLSKAKPTTPESTVLNQNAEAQRLGLDTAKSTLPGAQNLIGMGSGAYQPVLNYWSSILSGDRGKMTAAMAPEISRIGEGYKAAGETSAALNPRGGPSASFLSELPFSQQRDVTSLLQGARPQAAAGLLSGANGATGAGSTLLTNAINAIYGSTAAGRDILNQQQNLRETEAARGKTIGAGLFDLIQKYGFPAIDSIFKGKGLGDAGAGDIPSSILGGNA